MNAIQFNNLNKTPIRTKSWVNINDISLGELNIGEIKKFDNVEIKRLEGVDIQKLENDKLLPLYREFQYGVSEDLINEGKEGFNQGYVITIGRNIKTEEPIIIEFNLNKDNSSLVDNLIIVGEENSKASIIVKYKSLDDSTGYHNGICTIYSKKNSEIKLTKVNFLNENTVHFDSNVSDIEEDGKVDFISVDLGGQYSIYNYHGDLIGDKSAANINSIYLGNKDKLIDINYIITHKGQRSNSNINVKGALQGKARKAFKGTLDFKTGASKSVGAEDEYCMLLSKEARAKAMPVLLCAEDDVSGEHAASSGRIDENKLFYLMSRGLSYDEAKIVIVRAAFNPIIDSIGDNDVIEEILQEVDRGLKNE
ncbi:Fe-S cluster assembly protein SufD [Clostridium sp. 2-1]|uniref:Fe-S cluster assembly protein SufD n=1 Tax=Clostridium TaxID=1485 RepID=UPI000411C17A|nr:MULTISPECIES: Fe-S cluster assembly protein SufD [Clostridium]ALB48748.1 Fe-S cluster assembly protein SufD [Clostridium beijerinckii NRRL B-598]MBN7574302.1 Fe-S cluster assembly protein SufD [Clostridium beijerinckii]MBN7579359.1 Fe-S cluster assembly protein SufD [Clostridium beijerinckii]MBN7584052.1 Fe-S cluster assembly protein SufD [Clostridium beijerinckii]MBO0519995.1 Fe-S cluster assembly protein SufD [Clostridium beijerinckii]